jgi:hypothetical protein
VGILVFIGRTPLFSWIFVSFYLTRNDGHFLVSGWGKLLAIRCHFIRYYLTRQYFKIKLYQDIT